MTDSDNTMTLSLVTRRIVLVGTAIAAARPSLNAFACGDLGASQSADSAAVAWCEWRGPHESTEWLCRQQQLERKLIETIGYPAATTLFDDETVTYASSAMPEEEPSGDPIGVAAPRRSRSMGQLIRHAGIGQTGKLAIPSRLSETTAASHTGVATKLGAVPREGQSSRVDGEFPWPQIRSVFQDFLRMAS